MKIVSRRPRWLIITTLVLGFAVLTSIIFTSYQSKVSSIELSSKAVIEKKTPLKIQSQSKTIELVSQNSKVIKAANILNHYVQKYPISMQEPLFTYVMSGTVMSSEESWVKEKIEIEKRIFAFGNSELKSLIEFYDSQQDPFINQRLIEVAFKSSSDRKLKIEFLISRWFDLNNAFESDLKIGVQNTMTNSVILLSQLKPQVQLSEVKEAFQNHNQKFNTQNKLSLIESLNVYLPSMAHSINSLL